MRSLRVRGILRSWRTGVSYFDYGLEAWVSVATDRWEARRVASGLQRLGF